MAVIDSGIAGDSDLTAGNMVYSQDFTGLAPPRTSTATVRMSAGILAGNGSSSTGPNDTYTFKGIAGA